MRDKTDVVKLWKKWLIDIDTPETEIAKEEGVKQQTLNEKFRKGTIPLLVFWNILERHGYTIDICKKDK